MKGTTARKRAVGHAPEICANCGATLRGPYCSACGQSVHIHSDLPALVHDFAHGVFHFEGKFWRTLVLLAWQPGELTRRYIGGERTKFVSPIGLFLFSVFLMFAVASGLARYGSGTVAIVADAQNPADSLASVLAGVLIAPAHMYRQLKGAYRLDRFAAAWRTAALLRITCITSATFLVFLLYMGS